MPNDRDALSSRLQGDSFSWLMPPEVAAAPPLTLPLSHCVIDKRRKMLTKSKNSHKNKKLPTRYELGAYNGASDRNRTGDLMITSQVLYLLSYAGMAAKSG